MANALKHKKISAIADDPNTNLVRPVNWNEEHVFSGGAEGQVLRRRAAETDGVAWEAFDPENVPAAGATVVSETSFGQAIAVGVSTDYSRKDHSHGTPASPTIPTAADTVVTETTFGLASTPGVFTTFSRADHTHGTPTETAHGTIPSPSASVTDESTLGGASPFAGTAATYSRGDHTHGTPTNPASLTPGDTVVTETAYGQASTPGASADYSRKDHTHGTPAAGSSVSPGNTVVTETAFGLASTAGVSALYSRTDHTHGTPANPLGGTITIVRGATVVTPAVDTGLFDITHGLGSEPTCVIVTPTFYPGIIPASGTTIMVTAKSPTTFTVCLRKGNSEADVQTVYWAAFS